MPHISRGDRAVKWIETYCVIPSGPERGQHLSDRQLDIVSQAARALPVEKRDVYLQRIAGDLAVRHGFRFSDTDVSEAARAALQSLMQNTTA